MSTLLTAQEMADCDSIDDCQALFDERMNPLIQENIKEIDGEEIVPYFDLNEGNEFLKTFQVEDAPCENKLVMVPVIDQKSKKIFFTKEFGWEFEGYIRS